MSTKLTTKRMNHYRALLEAKREEKELRRKAHPAALKNRPVPNGVASPLDDGEPAPAVRGRPRTGHKRFSKDFQQVTAYVPVPLFDRTKINLIKAGHKQFTVLIVELLEQWNMEQPDE